MLTIIHGDNNIQIYKELTTLKAKFKNAEITTLVKPDALAVRQQLGSSGMFFDDRVTIIEGLLEKGVTQEFVDFLTTLDRDTQCIFVSYTRLDRAPSGTGEGRGRKKASATTLLKGKKALDAIKKAIPSVRIIACNDYRLFDFLDMLAPGNSKKIVAAYDELLANDYEAEQIFVMIVDQFHNLLLAKDGGGDALGSIHDFRKTKMLSQSRAFSQPKLALIYEQLFNLEVAQKQKRIGEGSPFSMKDDLRFLLANLFV